jgi:hypothetical protein
MNIRHVVYDRREGLRWYFMDTLTKKQYFLSLNPSDIKYLLYGVNILVPPFSKNHIKGNW